MLLRLLFFMGVLFLPFNGYTQQPSSWNNYLIRSFTAENGLPISSTFYAGKDQKGLIWFGTRDGIAKFDGKKITPYFGNDHPAVNTAAIYSMVEDSKGTLWFSSTSNGLISFQKGKFTTSPLINKFPSTLSKYLEITSGDSIWVSFYGGLSLVYKDSVLSTYTTANGLINNEIWLMEVDSNGALWVTTNNGLSIVRNDTILNYDTANGLSFNVGRAVTELKNGEVWVGTDGGGITVFQDYKPVRVLDSSNLLSSNYVQFIAQHPLDGSVWIANYETGVDVISGNEMINFNEEDGLISNHTMHIFIDEEQVWISTEEGVTQLRPRKIQLMEIPEPYPTFRVTAVHKDSNNEIWIGLNGDGIIRETKNGWTHYPKERLKTNGYVDAFAETADGKMWFGTQGTGMELIVNGKSEKVFDVYNGLPVGYIGDLHFDSKQNLWIATQNGLSVKTPTEKIKTFTREDGLPANFIYSMAIDTDDRIWGSTYSSGIFTFKAGDSENIHVSSWDTSNGLAENQITSLIIDGERIWLGGGNGSLQIFDGKEFRTFSIMDENINFSIGAMLLDSDGFVWIATSIGVIQAAYSDFFDLSYKDGRIPTKYFSTLDGLPGPIHPLADNKIIEDKNGNIIVATFNGAGVIPSAEKFKDYNAPEIFFNPILIDGNFAGENLNYIELNPVNRHLEIGISSPSFYNPEKIKYKYRLEGHDPEWTILENRNTLYYDFLPHGDYILNVMASDEMGNWQSASFASLSIKVFPPFYKTNWFTALMLLLFGGLIAGIVKIRYHFKMKELNHELAVQHQIQKERERISRDLHDNVGSHITNLITGLEISNLHIKDNQSEEAVSVIQHLDSDARGAMTELRETIWLLDQQKVLISDFEKHVKGFLKRQKYSLNDLNVSFINEVEEDLELNPSQSLHLLRIIQEALNNCRKHAAAKQFNICIKRDSDFIIATIKDDGIGMTIKEKDHSGNGLRNIERRAKELKGTCSIESKPGQGISISLIFPIIP